MLKIYFTFIFLLLIVTLSRISFTTYIFSPFLSPVSFLPSPTLYCFDIFILFFPLCTCNPLYFSSFPTLNILLTSSLIFVSVSLSSLFVSSAAIHEAFLMEHTSQCSPLHIYLFFSHLFPTFLTPSTPSSHPANTSLFHRALPFLFPSVPHFIIDRPIVLSSSSIPPKKSTRQADRRNRDSDPHICLVCFLGI